MAAAKAAGNKKKSAPAKSTAKAAPKPGKPAMKAAAKPAPKSQAKSGAKSAAKPNAKELKAKEVAKTPKGSKAPAPVAAVVAKGAKGAAAKAAPLTKERRIASPVYSGRGQDTSNDSVCREIACEALAIAVGYCRLHYIKNWKKIKRKELILKERKLNQYIEELVAKYPDKYIDAIREDLANDKEFAVVIKDLDLDESIEEFNEGEGEADDGVVEGIRRDFDDSDDGF